MRRNEKVAITRKKSENGHGVSVIEGRSRMAD